MRVVSFGLWWCQRTRAEQNGNIYEAVEKLMHRRAKVRNGVAPYAVDDEFELVVPCTCAEDHKPLTVDINQSGQPKEIKGNDACWYGMFEFCTSHLKKPTTKLLQNWKQSADCFFFLYQNRWYCEDSKIC